MHASVSPINAERYITVRTHTRRLRPRLDTLEGAVAAFVAARRVVGVGRTYSREAMSRAREAQDAILGIMASSGLMGTSAAGHFVVALPGDAWRSIPGAWKVLAFPLDSPAPRSIPHASRN